MTEEVNKWAISTIATIITVLAVFGIGWGITAFIMDVTPQENAKRVLNTVKAVCDVQRVNPSYEALKACRDAQNASQTEYLCKDGTCWVEDHYGEE